ncbi:elongator complex protein 6 [Silene latifolia]|uniref:elongator complex protein 6 n=1 Tax=Silene latifolia TaxID=37657 RepID=UPI003D7742D6
MEKSWNLLDEALGTSKESSSRKGSVMVIEDSVETSGAFVIHHILKRTLSSPHSSLIFISLSHPFSHYDRILRKLGCNLAAHKDNRRFFFFDMLMFGSSEDTARGLLIQLYGKIQKVVEDIASSHGSSEDITIVLDDFSLIEVAAKGSFNHSLDFLRYCYTLTSEAGCALVILNHEDIYHGDQNSTLVLQMEYLANILVKVESLATGLATDVHGQLTILNKSTDNTSKKNSMNKVHNYHFKIKENGVECFYPGTHI